MRVNASLMCALAMTAAGCIDTVTESTTIDLSVAGTAVEGPLEGRDGVMLTFDRADIAFGPFYLCAGSTSGALCDESLAEWRDATVVDALDPRPRQVATMPALTATARSFMYDYGIVSRLTMPEAPLVTPAAEELGPASVRVEGQAEVDGQSIPFVVAVRIEQSAEVEQGVPVVRSGESSGFEQTILPDGALSALVRFDPRPWLVSANFRALTEDADCDAERDVVCAGAVEQRCAEDGTVAETRACDAIGQVCIRDQGCVESLSFGLDSQVGRALRTTVEASSRPELTFEAAPQ